MWLRAYASSAPPVCALSCNGVKDMNLVPSLLQAIVNIDGEALATLVSPDGNDPAIDGFADKARPLSPAEKAMIAEAANRLDEQVTKGQLGVDHWVHDVSWREALERRQQWSSVRDGVPHR